MINTIFSSLVSKQGALPFLAAGATFSYASEDIKSESVYAFSSIGASSIVLDRGEQIGPSSLEATAGIELLVNDVALYGALYRLTPYGGNQAAFDDEFDYTIGVAWAEKFYEADLSANWLTYPGELSSSSLELAAELILDAPLTPTFVAFRDVHTKDWGLEIVAGPSRSIDRWTFNAFGRAGYVEAERGRDVRTYLGIETTAAYEISAETEISAFARYELSDQDTFVHSYHRGIPKEFRNDGFAIGVAFSLNGQLF